MHGVAVVTFYIVIGEVAIGRTYQCCRDPNIPDAYCGTYRKSPRLETDPTSTCFQDLTCLIKLMLTYLGQVIIPPMNDRKREEEAGNDAQDRE